MSKPVISIRSLGKRYKIGGPSVRYKTLRESIMNATRAPFNRLRRPTNFQSNEQSSDAMRYAQHPMPSSHSDDTIWALRNVSFEVKQGDIVGIIGANGAGKTTLLKILSRITRPTEGEVDLKGRVGSLLEVGTGFHPELTGRENIYLNGAILGMSKAEINRKYDEIVAFAEIEKFLDTPVKRYSTGMGTRLAFAVAAHLDPEILLVDEVLAVGDLAFRKKCLGKMETVGKEGRTVLFVSHDMNTIRRLCKIGLWLDKGKIQTIGDMRDVVIQYESSVMGKDSQTTSTVQREQPPRSPKYFSRVTIASEEDEPKSAFRFGECLRLIIGMDGRTPHATHFVQWFLNEPSQGNRVAWGTSEVLSQGDPTGDQKEISFLIGPLPLAEGKYSISLAMGVPAVIDLDFWYDAITFEVFESDPDGTGFHYTSQLAPLVIPYQ